MTITLYILGWLLSGFLAAWLAYRYVHKGELEQRRSDVAVFTSLGAFALLITLAAYILQSNYMSKPFFKAKEPK